MKVLITGNKSGIGKYIFENFGEEMIGWDRDIALADKEEIKKEGVDILIHCAFNSLKEVTFESLAEYIQDNVFLTKELVEIPHKKFIFFSSVDVYSKDKEVHIEDAVIDANSTEGLYGITKLISESIVKARSKNSLIMRSTAFLGLYSRKNSLKRIIEDEEPIVTLTSDSEFNYILYSDVLEFLQTAIEKDLQGIYNIASCENIKLSEVAEMFEKQVGFGEYTYLVGNIDNTKAVSIHPAFKKTSKQIIKEFTTL
ncbi:NAD-dependent epimerase/dehydratase family protein [Patescibacteria group bacterium]|nr:NAD-dependent epimerase/dehydratase family protein [Patescibacteria group bacterium]